MASLAQISSHCPQLTHFAGFTRYAVELNTCKGSFILTSKQLKGQIATQASQPEHFSGCTTGLGLSFILILVQVTPTGSITAAVGHAIPHTPHSMQELASIVKRSLTFP
jgi:hypothetical protein